MKVALPSRGLNHHAFPLAPLITHAQTFQRRGFQRQAATDEQNWEKQ
jgi:hypothetical protein